MRPLFNNNKYFSVNVWERVLLFLLFSSLWGCTHSQTEQPDNINYSKALDSASRMYDAGNEQGAIHYLDSATKRYTNLNLHQRFLYYSQYYNYYYFILEKKDSAMLYADSMLNLFNSPQEKTKYASDLGCAQFFKGDILFDKGKYDDAYEYYYRGKLIASENFDNCNMSYYSYRLGIIKYRQEHFEQAAAFFITSLQQIGKCDFSFQTLLRKQELFNNTGLSYSKLKKNDSALFYFNRSIKYVDSAGAQFKQEKESLNGARGVIYGNEANVYIDENNYPVAEALLKKSIGINLKEDQDNIDAQLAEIKLARLYEKENKDDTLISLLRNIKIQFDTIKNLDNEADWNLLMSNYYNRKKQSKLAFYYLLKNDSVKDIIQKKYKKLREIDINEQMERLNKNHVFTGLKKNNISQQQYLKIALLLAAMSLFIIFLVCRNWLKSRKSIKTLGALNNRISEQNHNLAYALDELSQSSGEKDRILRNVAHDLRNPLGGVASLTALMAEESEYTDEQKELINLIKETSNNSLELINEILEATDDISAKSGKKKELVEINALISQSIELLRFKAAEKQQEIQFESTGPIELNIIREQIWRVLSNLISNAIKFSTNGGLIQVSIIDEGKTIKIAVADNGIGIPDNLKDVIFNMFTDAKRPGTAGERSFGLGLSICRQIVENHKGKIWFESDGSTGTTFYMTLNKPKKG